jgi:hypothetical protein
MNLNEIFEKYNDEYLKFDRVENKLSKRRDIHAFLILDSLAPDDNPIISAASYEEICLSVNPDILKNVDDKVIIDLIRCGVWYESFYDCLKIYC